MELITSFLTFASGYFPATLGSLIAVWRKKQDVKFRELDNAQKFSMIAVAIVAIIIGICIGTWAGGAIVSYFGITGIFQIYLIQFATALNGLKIVDSLIASSEKSLDIITESIPKVVSSVMEIISDKITKIFGKK